MMKFPLFYTDVFLSLGKKCDSILPHPHRLGHPFPSSIVKKAAFNVLSLKVSFQTSLYFALFSAG